MAPDVNVRKPPAPVTFDCCKAKPPSNVCVCYNCDTLLHISCAERRKFQSFGGVLGVCESCDTYITSNPTHTINKDALTLANPREKLNNLEAVTKIKNKEIEQLKEKLKTHQQNYTALNEKMEERTTQYKKELEILNVLVSEMKDKNSLLVEKNQDLTEKNSELIVKCKKLEDDQNSKRNNWSYAQAAADNLQYKYKRNIKATQFLIITPKVIQSSEKTKSDIENKLSLESLNVQVIAVKKMNEGKVKVTCCNKDVTNKLQGEIHNTFVNEYEANLEKMEKPKIKIVGITKKYEIEELEQNLKELNFPDNNDKYLKVTYIQNVGNKSNTPNVVAGNEEAGSDEADSDDTQDNCTYNAYVQLDPEYFHRIMSTGETWGKVYVGWQRCNAYEDLNMSRCYKCSGYGHSSKKCKNKQQCVYCAGEHESKTCQNKQKLTCCNCSAANNKYKLNRKINHCASDYKKCETYKSRLAFLRPKTDYSIST